MDLTKDDLKPVASHQQPEAAGADAPMSDEEAKSIVDFYKGNPPPALFQKLSQAERFTLANAMHVNADVVPAIPGLGEVVGGALKYAPSAAKAAGWGGRMAAGGVAMGVGAEGGQAIGKALGLPPALTNILSMVTGMAGGHLGSGAMQRGPAGLAEAETLGTRTMPESDAAYEASTGHPRGVFASNRPPGFPAEAEPQQAMPPERGGTMADINERVLGKGLGRPPFTGTAAGSNISASVNNRGQKINVHDVSVPGESVSQFDPFNQDGGLDESRLERLFKQMDAGKARTSKMKAPRGKR